MADARFIEILLGYGVGQNNQLAPELPRAEITYAPGPQQQCGETRKSPTAVNAVFATRRTPLPAPRQ
jgi:hypothetical protein